MTLFGMLIVIAVALTCTMFATRQAMLGFACAMFWAITGAQAYILSTVPWVDIHYYLFFAAFGMAIFTMIAAYGLREKRDTLADLEMDEEEGEEELGYIDEGAESRKKIDAMFSTDEGKEPSKRRKELRDRSDKRRTGEGRKSRARG